MKKRKSKFITKIRYKSISPWGKFYRALTICERCRIKDGLDSSKLIYGICSFCGWKGRVHLGPSSYNRGINNDPKHKDGWNWRRGNSVWSRNRKDK